MTTYNPISVNLKATKPETGGEAEGNCVAAKRGGKQPKAKEQSQTQVNSIQLLYSASLLATGEACAKRNLICWHPPVIGGTRGCRGGWSEKMLRTLVRGVKGGKWFSLIDKVYADRTLSMAWEKVKSNAGGCGVDCITVNHFDKDSEARLLVVKEHLT